ncbi:MAG: YdeI/OmpD-associated family protein [Dermatophilaceae bacterium]
MDVDIERDTGPREVTVPADFQAALSRDLDAGRFFDVVSYSHK